MKASGLLRKIFNIKEDYIETIPGKKSPEEDKQNIEKFINKIKANRGKLISIGTATCSELRKEHIDRFDSNLIGPYSTGYYDDYEYYTDHSHHFIIHYKCSKRIEEKDL
jgi:hypothetical protein